MSIQTTYPDNRNDGDNATDATVPQPVLEPEVAEFLAIAKRRIEASKQNCTAMALDAGIIIKTGLGYAHSDDGDEIPIPNDSETDNDDDLHARNSIASKKMAAPKPSSAKSSAKNSFVDRLGLQPPQAKPEQSTNSNARKP